MKKPFFSGIQQMGIGVKDAEKAWQWYREHLQIDVPVFDETAVAELMHRYTGGKPRKRRAILAMNLNGGGGVEIWQYIDREPLAAVFQPQPGDLGILAMKIKSSDIDRSFDRLKKENVRLLSPITISPNGRKHFYFEDPFGNQIEMVPGSGWFNKKRNSNGGVAGAVIGVSDMEKSITFYKEILGYDRIEFQTEGIQEDMVDFDPERQNLKRVLLSKSISEAGPFSELLGPSEIELIETTDRVPKKIFEGRYWGDLGYIHLCFDIVGMKELKEKCQNHQYPFTVDSSDGFNMGAAAGYFSYIEDPDGNLIEFVETHKIPVLKKWGWYLNLLNRDRAKKLPAYLLRALSLNRVKNK